MPLHILAHTNYTPIQPFQKSLFATEVVVDSTTASSHLLGSVFENVKTSLQPYDFEIYIHTTFHSQYLYLPINMRSSLV